MHVVSLQKCVNNHQKNKEEKLVEIANAVAVNIINVVGTNPPYHTQSEQRSTMRR